MTKIEIQYEGDLHCRAVHAPTGTALRTDAPPDNQGKGESFSPTDLVGTAMGTCMLTIMGIYARRKGIDMNGSRVEVLKEMIADPARRIGRLTATFTLPARLTSIQRAALENAARGCPVHHSLHPDVQVDLIFRYA